MSAGLREALTINWWFWSGLAIGTAVFAALLEVTGGAWGKRLVEIALRLRRFLPISAVAYVPFLFIAPRMYWRSGVAVVITYIVAFWFLRTEDAARKTRMRAAVTLLIVYAGAFSLAAHDLIMSLEPTWVSTLFPAYASLSSVYGGIAA